RDASWRLYANGNISKTPPGKGTTFEPYAQLFGYTTVNVPSAGGIGSSSVTYPQNIITKPCHINLMVNTSNPLAVTASISNNTPTGFTVFATRPTAGTVDVLWQAIQPLA